MAADKILVFIPAYNCERQIPRVLATFRDAATARFFSEILVLDNGSGDGTLAAAEQAAKDLTILCVTVARNVENYGLGGSHKSAFAYALASGFTHVVVLHGDDQGDIRDLLPVLKANEHNFYDCCLGARFMKGSRLAGYSRFRIFGNLVFNAVFTLAGLKPVADLGAGLNIYATSFLRPLFYKTYADGLHFNCYMLLGTIARRAKMKFFPISWREEDQLSNVRLFRQAFQTLRLALGYAFGGKTFLEAEHREKSYADYSFNVLYRNEKKSA